MRGPLLGCAHRPGATVGRSPFCLRAIRLASREAQADDRAITAEPAIIRPNTLLLEIFTPYRSVQALNGQYVILSYRHTVIHAYTQHESMPGPRPPDPEGPAVISTAVTHLHEGKTPRIGPDWHLRFGDTEPHGPRRRPDGPLPRQLRLSGPSRTTPCSFLAGEESALGSSWATTPNG
jgi:hypothetical protein